MSDKYEQRVNRDHQTVYCDLHHQASSVHMASDSDSGTEQTADEDDTINHDRKYLMTVMTHGCKQTRIGKLAANALYDRRCTQSAHAHLDDVNTLRVLVMGPTEEPFGTSFNERTGAESEAKRKSKILGKVKSAWRNLEGA